MATLKPLHKPEDLAAVPAGEPVLVDLDPGSPEPEATPDKTASEPDTGVNVLKEQLEALKKANAENDRRRIDAETRATKAEQDRRTALTDKADTESDAVASGLAAAQAEQAAAQAALKTAGEAGDWNAIGELQARIGRAAADIREFERAAATLADQKERDKVAPQQVSRPTDINTAIDTNPQLLDTEKVWLKAHPETIIDPARNKELDVAYVRATRDGHVRGTPAYFDYIEKFMGYAPKTTEDADQMSVSAPVSRNERGNDGRVTGGKIMLTPEERDLAKSMGVTDIEYARQKVNFEQAKKADPEKYGNRS